LKIKYFILRCISCDKKLKEIMSPSDNHPNDACAFKSYGNYGSTIFDPMSDSEFLEINVCDECLKRKRDQVYHVRLKKRAETVWDYKIFDPNNE